MKKQLRAPWRRPNVQQTIASVAMLGIAACGTDPAVEVDVEPDLADTSDVADSDVAEDARVDADADPQCEGSPGFDCVQDCATDVSFPGVCIDGEWDCPPDMPIRFDDCDHGCPGPAPSACCDANGTQAAGPECILGAWSCEGGTSPDFCCPDAPLVCVVECSADPSAMACAEGELYCPEPTFDRTECGCGPDQPVCCDASGAPSETLCTESGWACAGAASPEFCRPGPTSIDGTWSELARLDCDGSESISADPIAEFILSGSGFELTYASGMFETFKNYWGSYSYDPDRGSATFVIDGGNTDPTNAVLSGQIIELSDGQAEWRGFWFGTNNDDPAPPDHCGYRMER